MKTSRGPKPTVSKDADDDYEDLENGFIIDYDAMSPQPSGKQTYADPPGGRRGDDSQGNRQRSKQRQSDQTNWLKSDSGNQRPQPERHHPPADMHDDDDQLPVYLHANPGSSQPEDTTGGDRSSSELTFYSKPMFDNPTDFEIWKSRTDNGGGMPYRNGADDPFNSSLRRPVNYAEINKYNADQQRNTRRMQDRVPWKSYVELYNENGQNGDTYHGYNNRDCNCDVGRVPSDMSRPQGPSPNKMAACPNCRDGRYCSRAKSGMPGCYGCSPQSFRSPETFLPPLSGTTTSQSVPLTFTATPGGDLQKVTVDINLKLVTPRQVLNNMTTSHAANAGRDPQHHQHHHHHHQQPLIYGQPPTSRKSMRCATCTGVEGDRTGAATNCRCTADPQQRAPFTLIPDLSNPNAAGLDWSPTQRGTVPPLSLAGLNNITKLHLIHPPPPKTHRHTKVGRYGEYRVFCADDYNKMKREMRLASTFGAEKDPETLQEKKEKLEVRKSYGRLVNDKNQLDLGLLKSKRIQAAMIAADEELANTARKFH